MQSQSTNETNEEMRKIYETDEFKIYKNDEKSKYKIHFNESSHSLIESIINCKIIPGINVEDDYRTIYFKARSVKSLATIEILNNNRNLPYSQLHDENEEVLKLCYYLSFQLKYLVVKQKKCFISYEKEKIIMINDRYVFLSNNNLMPLESEENIYISNPFKKTQFISPELVNVVNLPTSINYRVIYYSLGLVILFYLRQNMNNNEISDEDLIDSLEGTKLFYLIKGALDPSIENRRLLYL
jgi:hypothetical protein